VIVLDSSAILAVAFEETGADIVTSLMPQAVLSAANLAEVLTVAERNDIDGEKLYLEILSSGLRIIPVTQVHARIAGQIWRAHPRSNLSLGDRLCLALAFSLNVSVVTSDREMRTVGMGLSINLFR
jgi:PIN domain nuclease of toxin-antitoxin system